MAFTLADVLEGVRSSRAFFLKHVEGLREDQWDWKPYPECKSIRETLAHLMVNDRAALVSLEGASEPEYDRLHAEIAAETGNDLERLLTALRQSHHRLCGTIEARYAGAPLDTEIWIWGSRMTLGRGLAYLSSEDFYHAGQVAFIRMATDPSWDYYGFIYG